MISILSTVATILSIGGNFLLARKIVWVFPLWIVANFIWIGVVWVQSQNIQMITMYAVYIGTSIYSWICWRNSK